MQTYSYRVETVLPYDVRMFSASRIWGNRALQYSNNQDLSTPPLKIHQLETMVPVPKYAYPTISAGIKESHLALPLDF